MICTLSSAHSQQASKLQPCSSFSLFGKIEINAPINVVIIIIIIDLLLVLCELLVAVGRMPPPVLVKK